MKLKLHLLSLLAIVIICGCRKDQLNDCFQSTGKDKTITRSLSPFTKIKAGEKFDIILTQDTGQEEEVKITCGSHLAGQITTVVQNNTLTIENKNTCNFVRSYDRKISIEVRVRYLDDIEIYSATNLSSNDTLNFENKSLTLKNFGLGDVNLKLKAGILAVRCINSGDIILEGFSNILSCSVEEATQFDARKLLCDDVYVDCHTPLDCFVNARNYLYAKIFNDGNVMYVSEPKFKLELVEKRGDGELKLIK